MRGLVDMASRDKLEVDTFHKGIQYALERLGKSKFGFEGTTVSNFKSKSYEGSGNELVRLLIIPELRVLVLTKRHVGSGNEIGRRFDKIAHAQNPRAGKFYFRPSSSCHFVVDAQGP